MFRPVCATRIIITRNGQLIKKKFVSSDSFIKIWPTRLKRFVELEYIPTRTN